VGRLNVTRAYLDALLPTLSERDLGIIELVGCFKLATGEHIERLFFGHCSERSRTRNRQAVLRRLVDGRVLAPVGKRRVGGHQGGSATTVYALDVSGQRISELTSARPRRPYQHYEPTMQHTLLVAELYVELVEAERACTLTLLKFEAEPFCWRTFGTQTLKPDAFVQIGIETGGRRRKRSCFIEIDRAEEWGAKIASKLPQYLAYRDYSALRGQVFPKVLFLTVHERRVAYLEKLIAKLPAADRQNFMVALFDSAITVVTSNQISNSI
jgi:Replication-relaxation